jgi:hypothetical protein
MMRTSFRACVLFAMAACGPAMSGDGEDTTNATLLIEPALSEHVILNGVAAHQQFTAILKFPDGHSRDVTDETSFLIDSAFGMFTENDLALGTAGKTAVYGTWIEKTSMAEVIGRLKSVRVDPALPVNTPDLFNAPEDVALAPTVIYPAENVVMPRNLGDFETHWTSASLDIFEVTLATEFTDVRVYVPGGNGVGGGPNPSWMSFAATEWIGAVGREPKVDYQVRGVSTANPGHVGAAPPRTVILTNDSMEGGLYYWAAGATPGNSYGIFRHDMAKPGQPAEEYMTTTQTAGRCVACHVLSRDGSRMAITYDGGNGAATVLDVATKATQPEANAWNFGTFTKDGSQLLTVSAGVVTVRDGATQAPLTTMPAAGKATHPDLSVDGTKLVYVRYAGGADWTFGGGQIYTRSYDPTTQTFGAETPLVIDGGNNYYPSWSPDGQWIVFNRSDADAYNATNASIWIVKADGSQPPFELVTGNAGSGLTNSWARWAPFAQSTGNQREPMMWITVSSKRDFGTRLRNSSLPGGEQFPQLWMFAFHPERAGSAAVSSPAFRLPFQNLNSRNHIAQWTERVIAVQ